MNDFISSMKHGLEHHKAGRLDEAENFYFEALKFDPENSHIYNLIGLVSYEKGDDERAVEMFREAISRNRTRDDFYYNLGNALQAMGNKEEAAAAFRQSVMINSNNDKALGSLGGVLESMGRKEEALKSYMASIEINSLDAEIYFNAANLLSEMERYEEAAEYYLKAVELDPDKSSAAFFNYGNVCCRTGKLEEAVSYYEKALRVNPKNSDAYCNMGGVFKMQGDMEKAFAAYQAALSINREHVNALYNLASLLQNLGNYEEALLFFERVVELDPSHASAKHLADSLRGNTTKTAPRNYIVELFNEYSVGFEKHLTEKLNYRAPFDLSKLLDGAGGEKQLFHNVLDMGCGTGLSGEAFRPLSGKLTGIDIAPKMIEAAETKKIYDCLINDDIIEFLLRTEQKYDLFIATDVFIYVGFLEDIFRAVKRAAAPGARLVFSIESSDGKDCVLRPTGRYAHSAEYIRKLAGDIGFIIEKHSDTAIRKAKDGMVPGYLFILACPK